MVSVRHTIGLVGVYVAGAGSADVYPEPEKKTPIIFFNLGGQKRLTGFS